jgi:uncharacterized protein (DUF488 family)
LFISNTGLRFKIAGMGDPMARRAEKSGQSELPLRPATGPVPAAGGTLVLTVGHSSREIAALVALLQAHEVGLLFDVRAAPYSRRHPQFNREALAASLQSAGIGYRHMPALGGMRRPLPASLNTGWREDAYRGYADHMTSDDFAAARDAVLDAARGQRVAIMCAEADPAQCHRRLIADALMARGAAVEHIIDAGPRRGHEMTPFARVAHGDVSYPPLLHR